MDDDTEEPRVRGLTDRAALMAVLDEVVASGRPATFFLGDLDHFRLINDSFGYASGDTVLRVMGERLAAVVHLGDVTARLDGDEFGVLCFHTDPEAISGLERSVREAVSGALLVEGEEHRLTMSLGQVSVATSRSAIDVLASADGGLHLAKERGGNRTVVFDQCMRDVAMATLRRMSELRQAVAAGELVLHYQPIVKLTSGRTVGYESLLRWQHPREGLLAAGTFVDLLESSGLVSELTPSIVGEACSAAAALAAASSGRPPFVSVNLSARELSQTGIVELVREELERAGIKPAQLTLEITETAVVADQPTAVATLKALSELGVRVALDDFGTGHSSLLRLKSLPVTTVKIDRSFVTNLTRDADDLAIVASVVNLGATLGRTTTAEGVETREQAVTLRKLGCDHAQGHLYSPAQPLDELLRRLAEVRRGRQKRAVTGAALADDTSLSEILGLQQTGASLHTIAAALNSRGRRTTSGTRWNSRTVAGVISEIAFPELTADTAVQLA